MDVLVVLSRLNNGPCNRSGNRNGTRNQLVELPQTTPLVVVPDRSGWRCRLGVGQAPRRGPSNSGSYRFHPRPSAYRDRSWLGHQLGVRSSCRSSSASSAARVTQEARTPAHRVDAGICSQSGYRVAARELARLLFTQNDRESVGIVETRPVVTATEIRCATTLVKHSGNRRDTRIGKPLVAGSSPARPTLKAPP